MRDTTFGEVGELKSPAMQVTLSRRTCYQKRVVKVSTEQPGFTFRLELVWAFVNFHALTVHIRNTNVD